MYYYGGRETSDCEPGQYRPIVYHHGASMKHWSDEFVDYLGNPLPDLETATEAAYDWATDHQLSPLELE